MSLAGEGAVAIWHDIAPEGREAFYAWHGEEHMPERVGIPGFLRGRRYVARDADLEFFNLYETLTPQVAMGMDYRNRLDSPTPWTKSTVLHFRRVARSICRVAASFGRGQGGLAMTWRYDVDDEKVAAHEPAMAARLHDLARAPGIAGAHLLVADTVASAVDNAERKARGVANRIPGWIIMLEGWGDEAPFAKQARAALSDGVLAQLGGGKAELGLYVLQVSRAKTAWSAG